MSRSSGLTDVFFDIDGTLVDSNDFHARAWVDACAAIRKPVAFEAVRPLIGMGSDKLIAQLGLGFTADSDEGQALAASRKSIFLERYVAAVRPFPGAQELVERLQAAGVTCVVVSAASSEELDPLLAIAGLADAFDHVVSAQEIERSKPDPDIIEAALRWSGRGAQQAVMIGDTRYDIHAAHAAGVRCIALRCGGSTEPDLHGADAVFGTPDQLARALEAASLTEILERAEIPAGG